MSICRWLDSSKTLYEQDVKEHDLLYLRFKYYSFMDIDPRVSVHAVGYAKPQRDAQSACSK